MKLTKLQESQIDKLGYKINVEYEYELVPVHLESYSLSKQCYTNVGEKVALDGGKIHYGWSVHFNKNIIIEAERHAVWENDDEELICVTQNPSRLDKVIFLSDNTPVDPNLDIPNIRMNITNNSLINDWIMLCEVIDDLYFSYTQRVDNVQINMSEAVQNVIDKIELSKQYLMGVIVNGRAEKSNCYCEDGQLNKKKFIHCHKKSVQVEINGMMESIQKFKIR